MIVLAGSVTRPNGQCGELREPLRSLTGPDSSASHRWRSIDCRTEPMLGCNARFALSLAMRHVHVQYEEMPGNKAGSLLAMGVRVGDPVIALEQALRRHLLNVLGGDPDRDIDDIELAAEPDSGYYLGRWRGHPRLLAGILVDASRVVDIYLIATKGSDKADASLLGRTGPTVGNSILVARLFHVALFALRSAGVTALRNDPYTPRLRRLYEDMGFQDGAYLPLNDQALLTRAFTFIEQAYLHPLVPRGRLTLATPPLPL